MFLDSRKAAINIHTIHTTTTPTLIHIRPNILTHTHTHTHTLSTHRLTTSHSRVTAVTMAAIGE